MDNVAICNHALTYIGAPFISSLSDGTTAANYLTKIYAPTLNELLRAHPWSFATRLVELSEATGEADEAPEWAYAYEYPSDCLRILKVYNGDEYGKSPTDYNLATVTEFVVRMDSDADAKIILTNEEDAFAYYIALVEDEDLYDPLFVLALAYALAAKLAVPLKGDFKMQQAMQYQFAAAEAKAKAMDAREMTQEISGGNAYSDARA